jgi:hypothetical protein
MRDNKKIEKLERGKPWEEERKRGGEERREILFHQSRSPLEYKRYLNRLTTKP